MNGRLPATTGLIRFPDGDMPDFISGKILSIMRPYKLFIETRSHGIVSIKFLSALNHFLSG